MSKPIEAWCIKFPDGQIHFWQWEAEEESIIDLFEEEQGEEWRNLWNDGYRAVRVRITEVEE